MGGGGGPQGRAHLHKGVHPLGVVGVVAGVQAPVGLLLRATGSPVCTGAGPGWRQHRGEEVKQGIGMAGMVHACLARRR